MNRKLALRNIRMPTNSTTVSGGTENVEDDTADSSTQLPSRYTMSPKMFSNLSTSLTSKSASVGSKGRGVKPTMQYLHKKQLDLPGVNVEPWSPSDSGSKSSIKVELIPEMRFRVSKESWYNMTLPPKQFQHLLEEPKKINPSSKPMKKSKIPIRLPEGSPKSLKYFLDSKSKESTLMKLSKFQKLETESRGSRSQTSALGSLKKIRKESFQSTSTAKEHQGDTSTSSKNVRFASRIVLLQYRKDTAIH